MDIRRTLLAIGTTVTALVLLVIAPDVLLLLLFLFGVVGVVYHLSTRVQLFLLGFLFPMVGLRFTLSPFRSPTLLALFPHGIDVSVPDVIAALFVAIVLLRLLTQWVQKKSFTLRLPLFIPLVAFWGVGILSALVSAPSHLLGIKYVLYPIAWSAILWGMLPVQLVESGKELVALRRGMLVSGGLTALMGVLSYLYYPWIHRVIPFPVFGYWPFGENHNMLAETLVAVTPLALIEAMQITGRARRVWFSLATIFCLVALLTFARTAWICFLTMGIAALFFLYRDAWRITLRRVAPFLFFLIPIALGLWLMGQTADVQGSTASRTVMTAVAISLFRDHPILGVGPGTFIDHLGAVRAFTDDFGAPIEAHGLLQKIGAEMGLLGLLAFGWFTLRLVQIITGTIHAAERGGSDRERIFLSCAPAASLLIYVLFTTTYYSAKLWLPIGYCFAFLWLTHRRLPTY